MVQSYAYALRTLLRGIRRQLASSQRIKKQAHHKVRQVVHQKSALQSTVIRHQKKSQRKTAVDWQNESHPTRHTCASKGTRNEPRKGQRHFARQCDGKKNKKVTKPTKSDVAQQKNMVTIRMGKMEVPNVYVKWKGNDTRSRLSQFCVQFVNRQIKKISPLRATRQRFLINCEYFECQFQNYKSKRKIIY